MLNRFFKPLIFLLSFLFAFPAFVYGQVPSRAEVEAELNRRGIDQGELERRLKLRGIDVYSIDPTDPVQVEEVGMAVREIVQEMEKESDTDEDQQLQQSSGNRLQTDEPRIVSPEEDFVPPNKQDANVEKIQKALNEGASVEEALKTLSDVRNDTLPSPVTWGQQIFRDKNIRVFVDPQNVKPPDTYILGVGDFVTVSIWGYSQDNIVFEINSEGYIKPERMKRIYLKGVTLGKAKNLLRKRFAEYYRFRPEEFELTLNFSRTITVNVVGEVYNFGSYTFPAINTAFNALMAADGPTNIGSVRKIKLIRPGKLEKVIDVYKFLLNPATQEELFLEENDFIHVPIAERVVEIKGAVNRPNRYELIEGEELIQLIKYAGGLKDDALRGNIQIKRIENDREIIIDADIDKLMKTNQDFKLKPADIITINKINKGIEDYVNISGTVEFPGQYAFTEGIKISDIVKRAVLKREARKDVAILQRTNVDGTVEYVKIELGKILENSNSSANLLLRPKDKIIIYSQDVFTDKFTIEIKGNVRTPATFPYDLNDTLRVSDLILLGDGLNPTAAQFAYLKRYDVSNKEEKDYIKVDVFEAISNPRSPSNIMLQPYDILTVLVKESYTDIGNVKVEGAVRSPKDFEFTKGMRVSDLIYLADGLRPESTDFGYLKRKEPSKEKEIEYIRVDLEQAIANPSGPADIMLEIGDVLTTFSKTTFRDSIHVEVLGSVRNPGLYEFDESLKIKDILTMAGGLTMEAAKNKVDVFRIEFSENNPTKTVDLTLILNDDFEIINNPNFEIKPFDQIVIRNVPDFEFQKNVTIEGEVFYPGNYAILNEDEPISSLVERAGGVTQFSFPAGATLKRLEDDLGFVIIEMDKILKNKSDKSNIYLKDGDVIFVPKAKDLVSINGNIRARELYPDEVLNGGRIHVPFSKRKRAMHYVRKHGGGIGVNGSRKSISVTYPNGEVKKARNFLVFSVTPKVKPGTFITVGEKPKKKEEINNGESERVDWNETFGNVVTQTTAILTLLLLINQL